MTDIANEIERKKLLSDPAYLSFLEKLKGGRKLDDGLTYGSHSRMAREAVEQAALKADLETMQRNENRESDRYNRWLANNTELTSSDNRPEGYFWMPDTNDWARHVPMHPVQRERFNLSAGKHAEPGAVPLDLYSQKSNAQPLKPLIWQDLRNQGYTVGLYTEKDTNRSWEYNIRGVSGPQRSNFDWHARIRSATAPEA